MVQCMLVVLGVLVTSMTVRGQEMNPKFSASTQMFLLEQQEQAEQSLAPQQAPVRITADEPSGSMPSRMIASPDTINGTAYISCFIHLADPSDLTAVCALGVLVEETFDGLNFITASVPVAQLEALAGVENVTYIKVAELMQPMTDVAREFTNVKDLLTLSESAASRSIDKRYDGSGIILGIIDTGIDFQHIAFKDKNDNSRIKRGFIYNGSTQTIYDESNIDLATTDTNVEDHGTHTSSTAGGSSVTIGTAEQGFPVTVTDDHSAATYGGMAPGADLYLAAVKGLKSTYLANALVKMVAYADSVEKPIVISNSWGSASGPRNGTGELATLVAQNFGDTHPNHIILFATANNAGKCAPEDGGYFVKKTDASSASPLATVIRQGENSGDRYAGSIVSVWADATIHCKLYILNNVTGAIETSWEVTGTQTTFSGFDTYYTGSLKVLFEQPIGNQKGIRIYPTTSDLKTKDKGKYVLAIEVYPTEGTANINMWGGQSSFFTADLTTAGHTWIKGTDDMTVSDETTIPDAISVGAYMSKTSWYDYEGTLRHYPTPKELGEIAFFSSYATSEMSPTNQAYPYITAPGAMLVAGVNHFHTTDVDTNSYFGPKRKVYEVVYNTSNPYACMQGTSMATPVTAGIVALWLQAAKEEGKTLTVNQVKDIMRRTAANDYYTTAGANKTHFGHGKIDALAGIRYIVDGALDLEDNAYNDVKVRENAGSTTKVMLYGRTLWKDGGWNTLCLPFNADKTGPLADATIMELDAANSQLSGNTLTLQFVEASSIVAGKPYLVKWDAATEIVNPTFSTVTVSNATTEVTSSDGSVTFAGSYSPVTLTANDRTTLYLGAANALYFPSTDMTIGACRAYFRLNTTPQTGAPLNIRLDFEENVQDNATATQDLDADGTVTKFIQNGHIYIRKSAAIYDPLGRRIK